MQGGGPSGRGGAHSWRPRTTTSYSFPGRRPSKLWVGPPQRLEKQTYQQETAPTGDHSLSPLTHTPRHGRRTGLPRRGTWLELAPCSREDHPGCPTLATRVPTAAGPRPAFHLTPTWPPWSLGPKCLLATAWGQGLSQSPETPQPPSAPRSSRQGPKGPSCPSGQGHQISDS